MFVHDDVTWLPPLFLSRPLHSSDPHPSPLYTHAKGIDIVADLVSRRVEDAHVQLFGHFVAASQLCYFQYNREDPNSRPRNISARFLLRERKVLSRASRVIICSQRWIRGCIVVQKLWPLFSQLYTRGYTRKNVESVIETSLI